jgi:hypothetical protein
MLTRRTLARGGVAVAVAAILPARRSAGQETMLVRRSIGDLVGEQSPVIDAYRRGVDVMMKRDIRDKTSWLFQAAIHDIAHEEITEPLKPLAKYWQRCPHQNYFFLSWHRMYIYFFERIVRKASGDPTFALPYWSFEDPLQASLPACFLPDADELRAKPPVPPRMRRNSLARAKRLAFIDSRLLGLGSVAREVASTLALDRFSTTEALDAQQAFGGVASADPLKSVANGGIEASPHNLVHMTIGLSGDMGSPKTAARDPIFWLHHANIDRMWVRWTDAARGRFAPVDDPVWMTTKFTFVDENGEDRVMTGAEVLDTQFQLGYRYDDDAPRQSRLEHPVPVIAAAPLGAPKGAIRGRPSGPVVLARADGTRRLARQIRIALNSAPQNRGRIVEPGPRVRLILHDVAAPDAAPPYDVFLASAPPAGGSQLVEVKLGTLAIFGGAGRGMHAHGSTATGGTATGGATIVFEATDAIAELARQGSWDPRHLAVSIVRRGFAQASGGDFFPPDPDPPRIGPIELLLS